MDLWVGYGHDQNAGSTRPGTPSLAVLPKGDLRDIYQLARSGDVHRLERRLRELRSHAPGMEPAVDALLRCVSEFDMTRLRGLLQPLIEGSRMSTPADDPVSILVVDDTLTNIKLLLDLLGREGLPGVGRP